MSRSGNQNLNGMVRAEIIGGPDIQFVAGTNSGRYASITRNGVGSYTVNVALATPVPLDGSSVPDIQLEGTALGIATSQISSATTIEVRTFDNAAPPVLADLPFALRLQERFVG